MVAMMKSLADMSVSSGSFTLVMRMRQFDDVAPETSQANEPSLGVEADRMFHGPPTPARDNSIMTFVPNSPPIQRIVAVLSRNQISLPLGELNMRS